MGSDARTIDFNSSWRSFAVIFGIVVVACLMGGAIALTGNGPSNQTIIAGVLAVIIIGAVACFVADLPVIEYVRFAFIASFFFKGDIMLFKINEVEDPSGLNFSLTLLTATILLAHFLLVDTDRTKVFTRSFAFLLTALFIVACISVLLNESSALGWFSVFSFLTSALVAFVIAAHFSYRDGLKTLIAGTAAGLLFTGVVALAQYFLDFPTSYAVLGTGTEEELLGTQSILLSRVPAFLRTPTEMAWVIASLIPLVVAPVAYRVADYKLRQRILLLAAALLGTVAVILSLARGSWVSLVVAVVIPAFFAIFSFKTRERKRYLVGVLITASLGLLLLAPFSARIYDRLTGDDEGSALIRIPLMETASRMIAANPVTGVGLNNYRDTMTKYDETGMFVSQVFPNPVHNVFAHITAEIGIPGGIIFCLLILTVLYECFRSLSAGDRLLCAIAIGTGAGIIGFVISAMKEPGSLGSVRPPIRTLFFLFGTALAISRMRRRLLL
ncbi:MAG: O-antigen ligase family protein [Pyrinomonadaceae bacterium]